MHHAIEIEENSDQNVHIWPNLTCVFRYCLFLTLPLEWLGLDFNVIAIPFWAILDRRWTSPISPERCPSDVAFFQNFAIFGTIFAIARFMPNTSVKLLGMSRTVCQHYQQSLYLSLQCCNIFIGCLSTRATSTSIVIGIFSVFFFKRLCHNWTCVLFTADWPNAKVNFSNVLAHFI